MEDSETPWKIVSMVDVSSPQRSTRLTASSAACLRPAGAAGSAATSRSRSSAMALRNAPSRAAAAVRVASSPARRSISAMASSMACRAQRSRSLPSACDRAGSADRSPALPIFVAAALRTLGSGFASWLEPENASMSGRRARRKLRPAATS